MSEIKEIIIDLCKDISVPVLCKNNTYADSSNGRKLIYEKALLGIVEYPPGSKQVAKQRLENPIHLDFAWQDNGEIFYLILRAQNINKNGLEWESVLDLKLFPCCDRPLSKNTKEEIEFWMNAQRDCLFYEYNNPFAESLWERLGDILFTESEEPETKFLPLILLTNNVCLKDIAFDTWLGNKKTYFYIDSQRKYLRNWLNGEYSKKYRVYRREHGFKKRKYGFELEFTGVSRDTAAKLVAVALNGDMKKTYEDDIYHTHTIIDRQTHKCWKIVKDGSIIPAVFDPEGSINKENYKCELVSPVLEYKELKVIEKIVKALYSAGAMVNFSCGMHVHVDVEDYSPIMLRNLVNITYSRENILLKALGVSELRSEEWCKKLDRDFVHDINRMGRKLSFDDMKCVWYKKFENQNQHYNRTRYQLLNLHSFFENKGVEFRIFNGTLDYEAIRSNIILSLAICSTAASQSKAVAFDDGYSANRKDAVSKKDMSSWLYQLGLQGKEYKYLREYLKRNLTNHVGGVA